MNRRLLYVKLDNKMRECFVRREAVLCCLNRLDSPGGL